MRDCLPRAVCEVVAVPVTKERELRMAMKRLCTAALDRDGTWYAHVCQGCKAPCKYGTLLLRHNGLERTEPKETPTEKAAFAVSGRLRRCVRGYNRYSITRR